jgi:hypothetical protein
MAIRRRTVTGNVQRADAPWAGAAVTFCLLADSYTSDAQFPAEDVTAPVDAEGDFSISLWCDEDGFVATRYQYWLPNRLRGHAPSGSFDLAFGDGSPVNIFVLISAGAIADTPEGLLYAVIESEIGQAVAGRRTVTESTALTAEDYAIVVDSEDDLIIALPPASSRALPYLIKNIGAGLATLEADAAETIDRAATLEMVEGGSRIVLPVSGGWETW